VFASAFLAAGAIVARRLRELGKPVDFAYEMALSAMVGGLVGARIYYLIQNYSLVKHDLIGSLFSGSGLVWSGGVIGGAIAVLAWAAWRGMLNLALLDLASVPLAMGYAIGRIGCQVSGDGDLLLSGLERLLVEFVRRNHRVAVGLTAPQMESIALMLAGVAWLLELGRRGGIGPRTPRIGLTPGAEPLN